MIQCPTCGADCLPDDRFCGHCGAALAVVLPTPKVKTSLERFRALSAFDTAGSIDTSPLRDRVKTRAGLAIPPVALAPESKGLSEPVSAEPPNEATGAVSDSTSHYPDSASEPSSLDVESMTSLTPEALDDLQAALNATTEGTPTQTPAAAAARGDSPVYAAEVQAPEIEPVDESGRTLMGMPSVQMGDFWGTDDTEAPDDSVPGESTSRPGPPAGGRWWSAATKGNRPLLSMGATPPSACRPRN